MKKVLILMLLLSTLFFTSCKNNKKDEASIDKSSIEFFIASNMIVNMPIADDPTSVKVLYATCMCDKDIISCSYNYNYENKIEKETIYMVYNNFQFNEQYFAKNFNNFKSYIKDKTNYNDKNYEDYHRYYFEKTIKRINTLYTKFEADFDYKENLLSQIYFTKFDNLSLTLDSSISPMQNIANFIIKHCDINLNVSINIYLINQILHEYKESQGWYL